MQNSYRIVCSNELTHHGINGQRWGQRNGPPYPLDYESHSRKEKAENSKSEIGGTNNKFNSSNNSLSSANSKTTGKHSLKLTEKQKKYIKTGAIVVGSILAVSGGIYIANKLNGGNIKIGKGLNISGSDNLGFKLIEKEHTITENAAKVNPNRVIDPYDPAYTYTNFNCGNCTTAFEMRMRGLDVQAKGNRRGMTYKGFKRMFSGFDNTSEIILRDIGDRRCSEVLTEKILKQYTETDARGAVLVPLKNGSSHWINWVKKGNEVFYIDAQDVTRDVVTSCLDNYKFDPIDGSELTSLRLDNLKINKKTRNAVIDYVGVRDMTNDAYDLHFLDGESEFMKKLIIADMKLQGKNN